MILILFLFVSYYLSYQNYTSRKFNVLVTFVLFTLRDHGYALLFDWYSTTIIFMFLVYLTCKIEPLVESWFYSKFGYDSVKFLAGNTPGNLARKAVFTSLGYIAVKQIDHYTTTELIIHKANAHIDILTKSGEKLDAPTLDKIFNQANSEFRPSLLNKIENIVVDVSVGVIKHGVALVKEVIDENTKK
jgi:hypothetical protein